MVSLGKKAVSSTPHSLYDMCRASYLGPWLLKNLSEPIYIPARETPSRPSVHINLNHIQQSLLWLKASNNLYQSHKPTHNNQMSLPAYINPSPYMYTRTNCCIYSIIPNERIISTDVLLKHKNFPSLLMNFNM